MIAYQAHRIPFMSVRLGNGFETQAAIRSSPVQDHVFVFFSMSGIIGNLQSIEGFMRCPESDQPKPTCTNTAV